LDRFPALVAWFIEKEHFIFFRAAIHTVDRDASIFTADGKLILRKCSLPSLF